MSCLDKIIEECDDDQVNNQVQTLIGENLSKFIDEQEKKIKDDDLKIELDI